MRGFGAGIAEGDDQLAPIRALRCRPADLWIDPKGSKTPVDRLRCTSCGVLIPLIQKAEAARQSADGASCEDYLWHSGISDPSSVLTTLSHAETSSPVRCNPSFW